MKTDFGFISKKKLARVIAKRYLDHENTPCPKEQFTMDCHVQSELNWLCYILNIKTAFKKELRKLREEDEEECISISPRKAVRNNGNYMRR